MCHTPASHWSVLPPTVSIRCLRRLSSRVALAQLVPRRYLSLLASPAISTGMLSSCKHFASWAHLLPSVLSHFHISISSVSSRNDSHAHCSHARLRSRSVSCRATSSCLRHLWRWRHNSCVITPTGLRYSMPFFSFGRVNTSNAVVRVRPHAHLYAWTHTASSR